MYRIYEDDFAASPHPQLDSDGALEMYWDHPDVPRQWSGRHAPWDKGYPSSDSDNWSVLIRVEANSMIGVWAAYEILLNHFGLRVPRTKVSPDIILNSNPDELWALSAQ